MIRMKKYNYIDFMKTMAMFMVIVAHCTLFFSDNEFWPIKADQESVLLRWICNFVVLSVVPIFTFAAGFLLQLSLQKNKDSMAGLIRKKAVRLLIPYYIYGTLWLVPTYTFFDIPSYGRDKGASLIEGYKAMALGEFSDVAWFLLMLFWITLVWILLKGLLKKENLVYGAIVSFILFFIVHICLTEVYYFKISQIYVVVFFAGAAFFYISDVIYNNVSKWILIVGSLIGIAVCVCLAQISTKISSVEYILRVVIPVIFAFFAMGLCRTKAIGKLEETAVYKWFRKNSLYIYLLQAPGVYIVFKIVYPLIGSHAVLCFLVMFTLTTLIDVILTSIYVFIKKRITSG